MELTLVRRTLSDKSTEGTLFIDNDRECFTLEDPVRPEKIKGITAIPKGRYKVGVTHSPRFNKLMPILLDVPNFEGVRIHTGNKPEDTEGCILVGSDRTSSSDNWIGSSRVAYDSLFSKLMQALNSGEEIWINVLEDFN